MSEKELQELCSVWQKRLRLQDWDVFVEVVPKDKLRQESQAECRHTLSKKIAHISIIREEDYPSRSMVPQDQERDLVHELLHLHFAPFCAGRGTLADDMQEQAVHAISCALVDLARRSDDYECHGHLDTDN